MGSRTVTTNHGLHQPEAEPPATPADACRPFSELDFAVSPDHLISIREIRAMFGLGRTAAYELTHRPGFPAAVRISARCYRWWAAEVAAFAAALRQQPQPAIRRRSPDPAARAECTPAPQITGTARMARRRRTPS